MPAKKKLKQDAVFLAHNQRPGFHKGTFFALRDKQDGLVAYKIPYITCQVFFFGDRKWWRLKDFHPIWSQCLKKNNSLVLF